MKTLVVEDNFVSRQITVKVLEPFGLVDSANDGSEAIDSFRLALGSGKSYDLVMLDLGLPSKTGHEVLREIRKMETNEDIPAQKRAKIIILSSTQSSRNKIIAMKDGADKYMSKPINREQLIKLLKTLQLID